MLFFEIFEFFEVYYLIFGYEICYWICYFMCFDCSFGCKCWGDEGYVQEELVVEFGVVFLVVDLGLLLELCDEYVLYIVYWFEGFCNDKKFIF